MAHKTNTGNRHIYKYTKHLKTYTTKKKKRKKSSDATDCLNHTLSLLCQTCVPGFILVSLLVLALQLVLANPLETF